MKQHDETYVQNLLMNIKKENQKGIINLRQKVFNNQYFKNDTCSCVENIYFINTFLQSLISSIDSYFSNLKINTENLNKHNVFKKLFYDIENKLKKNQCIIHEIHILIKILEIEKIQIKFQYEFLFFLDISCLHH